MKLRNILIAGILSVTFANANDVLQKSMNLMSKGMSDIQAGFINNNADLIGKGLKSVSEGNKLFSDPKVIAQYLPKDKQHLINVATNQAERISLDSSVLEIRLSKKEYINAANAYSDMLNACARCHSIVRSW